MSPTKKTSVPSHGSSSLDQTTFQPSQTSTSTRTTTSPSASLSIDASTARPAKEYPIMPSDAPSPLPPAAVQPSKSPTPKQTSSRPTVSPSIGHTTMSPAKNASVPSHAPSSLTSATVQPTQSPASKLTASSASVSPSMKHITLSPATSSPAPTAVEPSNSSTPKPTSPSPPVSQSIESSTISTTTEKSIMPSSDPSSLAPKTFHPSTSPTSKPTLHHTLAPSIELTTRTSAKEHSETPSQAPTTGQPSGFSTSTEPTTINPTRENSIVPSQVPSPSAPTPGQPSRTPTSEPTTSSPTVFPLIEPTTMSPTKGHSMSPTSEPIASSPTAFPSIEPTTIGATKQPPITSSHAPSPMAPTTGQPSMSPTPTQITSSSSASPSIERTSIGLNIEFSSVPSQVQTSRAPATDQLLRPPTSTPTVSSPALSPSMGETTIMPTEDHSSVPSQIPTNVQASRTPTSKPATQSSSPTFVPSIEVTATNPMEDYSHNPSHASTLQVPTTVQHSRFPSFTPTTNPRVDRTRPPSQDTSITPTFLLSTPQSSDMATLSSTLTTSPTFFPTISFAPFIDQIKESSAVPSMGPVVGQSKPVSIGGVVWNDLNSNGMFDEGESGVGNVIIHAQTCAEDKVVALGSSTRDGSYVLRNIGPPGCYYLIFMESERYDFTSFDAEGDQISGTYAKSVVDSTGRTPNTILSLGETNLSINAGIVYRSASSCGPITTSNENPSKSPSMTPTMFDLSAGPSRISSLLPSTIINISPKEPGRIPTSNPTSTHPTGVATLSTSSNQQGSAQPVLVRTEQSNQPTQSQQMLNPTTEPSKKNSHLPSLSHSNNPIKMSPTIMSKEIQRIKVTLFETPGGLSQAEVEDASLAINDFFNTHLSNFYFSNGNNFDTVSLNLATYRSVLRQINATTDSDEMIRSLRRHHPNRRVEQLVGTVVVFDVIVELYENTLSDGELIEAFLKVSKDYNEVLVSRIISAGHPELGDVFEVTVEKEIYGFDKTPEPSLAPTLWTNNFIPTVIESPMTESKSSVEVGDEETTKTPMIIIAITGVAALTMLIFIIATRKKAMRDVVKTNGEIPANIHNDTYSPNSDTFENSSNIEYIETEADIGFELHENDTRTAISSVTDWNDYSTVSLPIYMSANETDCRVKGFSASKVDCSSNHHIVFIQDSMKTSSWECGSVRQESNFNGKITSTQYSNSIDKPISAGCWTPNPSIRHASAAELNSRGTMSLEKNDPSLLPKSWLKALHGEGTSVKTVNEAMYEVPPHCSGAASVSFCEGSDCSGNDSCENNGSFPLSQRYTLGSFSNATTPKVIPTLNSFLSPCVGSHEFDSEEEEDDKSDSSVDMSAYHHVEQQVDWSHIGTVKETGSFCTEPSDVELKQAPSQESKTSTSSLNQFISDLVWLEQKISKENGRVEAARKLDIGQIENADSFSYECDDFSPRSFSDESSKNTSQTMSISCRDCYIPPGDVGIEVVSTKDGPMVIAVQSGRPIDGHLKKGDLIIAVNDCDTRSLSGDQVMATLSSKSDCERKITVLQFGKATQSL
ncbi:hypothetical protein ACHAXS_009606 [Conticribra weissflogii]